MQGKLIIAVVMAVGLAPSAALAAELPRQGCQRGEAPQQIQRVPQRQEKAQPQQWRKRPEGCPITRTIPSVVDPTPTFVL